MVAYPTPRPPTTPESLVVIIVVVASLTFAFWKGVGFLIGAWLR